MKEKRSHYTQGAKGSALTPSLVWYQFRSSPASMPQDQCLTPSGPPPPAPRTPPPPTSQMCRVPGWHFS